MLADGAVCGVNIKQTAKDAVYKNQTNQQLLTLTGKHWKNQIFDKWIHMELILNLKQVLVLKVQVSSNKRIYACGMILGSETLKLFEEFFDRMNSVRKIHRKKVE